MPGSRVAMIIERAPLPIVEVQGSAHTVSHVNSAFCRLLGKTREDLIGKSFADIVHGGDQCVPLLDRVYQTGEAATLAQADESDSASWLYAMWPALDENAQPEAVLIQLAKTANLRQDITTVNEALLIAGLHQHELTEVAEKLNVQLLEEITERKQAEERARASEMEAKRALEYAEATLRTTPVPFLVLRADLRVNTASEAFYADFKVGPAETEGQLIYEIGNGQWNIPKLRELLEEIIPKKNIFNGFEVVHEFATIGTRTMLLNARRVDNAEGVPERILLAIEDITERRKAEEVQARLGAIVSSADDGILSKTLDGVVSTWNASAERLFGYTAEEIIGNPSLHLTPPDLFHEDEYILKQILAGKAIKLLDTQRMTKDGRRLPVSLTISPIKDAAGKVIGASKIVRDITERKKAEDALKLAMLEIARSSRAKDDFLAALSHELRTPLTPVLMTASALEDDTTLPDEVREQLAMMRRNIELEARLIDDLLDLTRISHGKMQIAPVATDIHQLLEHTAEMVRSEGHGKQVRPVFRLEAARHHALVDPTRLQQVFWNVIKNALKFTPTGGCITVGTRNDAGGKIVVSVEDTGIGISAKALSHVFNAFEQGDVAGQHRYGGLGLGLAISRAIIEVHGGAIRADSAGAGRGATFTVCLATVDAPATPALASDTQTAPGRALRLLIVEDHEATRTVLTRLLTRSGHHITAATTMREALTAFAAERFDAVISDLGLPDGSGLDLMREIQRQRPVPAIALSGYGMEDDLRQTKAAGFSAHLVKPVNLDQLRLLLDRIAVPMA
ncbi:MAG: PAS domain S-box protein [Chthoniobacteraceae bacterium]